MPPRKVNLKRNAQIVEPENYEDAVEAGVFQVDQAERYIFGEKALRHYTEAKRLFESALKFRPGDVDASYHLGRVLFCLATTFEPAPQCVATLRSAVTAYRAALVETDDDTAFNLATALATLGEQLSDGAQWAEGSQMAAWREALDVFLTTEHLQRALLNQAGIPAESTEAATMEEDASAEEMSPATIIETLNCLVDVLASLYASTDDPTERQSIWQALTSALERAETLDATDDRASAGPIARAQALAIVARVEADFASSSDEPPNLTALLSAIDSLERVLSSLVGVSEKPAPVEAVTDLADARSVAAEILLRFATSSHAEDDRKQIRVAGLDQLKQAFDAYTQLVDRLSASLLHANHGVPAHLIPSTLSATQSARSRLLLLLATSSPTVLDGALEVAIKAVEACGAGLAYRSGEQAFTRSAQGRNDWTTMKALRDATLCLTRAGFQDLGVAARLLKMSGATSAEIRSYVDEDLQGDAIWLASDGAERTMWERVIGALEAEVAVNAQIPGR